MIQINFETIKPLFEPLTVSGLQKHWERLHAGDCEVFPEDSELQEAWLQFHNGNFKECMELAKKVQGGRSLVLKARSTEAFYLTEDMEDKVAALKQSIDEAEQALREEQGNRANLYYQMAYALGRYGQLISVSKALKEGLAGKVNHSISECLQLEPAHADAHTSFGTYQAELIGKLGKMAAKLTYSATTDSSVEHYEKAIELAPFSVSAKTEFADGLLKMFGKKKLDQAVSLYEASVSSKPVDALEAMDYWLAQQELETA